MFVCARVVGPGYASFSPREQNAKQDRQEGKKKKQMEALVNLSRFDAPFATVATEGRTVDRKDGREGREGREVHGGGGRMRRRKD